MHPDPTPSRTIPSRGRGTVLAALLALTLGSGAAARWGAPDDAAPDPGPRSHHASAGPLSVSARVDRTRVLQGGDGLLRVELRIAGEDVRRGEAARLPTDLVVVLDRSGSMQGPPLQAALAAVRALAERLGDEDRFALVTYASGGEVAIPLERVDRAARQRWERVLSGIGAGGGTEMSRGLDLAHALVAGARAPGRVPRVVLLSDGHANEGDPSPDGLRARAARAVAGEYVLSAAGVGQGFDEALMSALADAGTGNFYYLPDAGALAGVFDREFAAARETVASALEVEVRPGAGVQVQDAAGYPLLRDAERVRFRPGDVAAGQERLIWLTLQAPTDARREIGLGALSVVFRDRSGVRQRVAIETLPRIACVEDPDAYYASFDADAYRQASRETLGRLKQDVAALIASGRQQEAIDQVDEEFAEMEALHLRALGYVVPEVASEAQALRDALAAPAAAAPAEQQRLGKVLLEAGRDERRVGSKRD